MRDLSHCLVEALALIAGAAAPGDIWLSVKGIAEQLGYTHMSGADAARLAGGATNAILYTDAPRIPADIDRTYNYASAPFVERALRSPEPFLMSEMLRDAKSRGPWTNLLADVIKQGEGLAVPVFDGDEPVAGFMFGGLTPDTSPYARAVLQVVAHSAFARYRALSSEAMFRPYDLSAREIQCLRLAIAKSDREAAFALGISSRTVRFHIDNAKKKLGCRSRIEAVSKALREHIIAA